MKMLNGVGEVEILGGCNITISELIKLLYYSKIYQAYELIYYI